MLKTFEYLINAGVESLEMVADAEKKATICAELAKAIAMSGALNNAVMTSEDQDAKSTKKEEKKANKKSNTKKDALKPEASKGSKAEPKEEAETVEEEPVQTPAQPEAEQAAPQPEVEVVDEWTEEMQQLKASQLELLSQYCEAWGEDFVYNDCLSAMTEGQLVGAENVRPTNIDGFLVYLEQLAQQQ